VEIEAGVEPPEGSAEFATPVQPAMENKADSATQVNTPSFTANSLRTLRLQLWNSVYGAALKAGFRQDIGECRNSSQPAI
jgi:hypothetical protein